MNVKISKQKGETVFITDSDGPWLFIALSPGVYNLEASLKEDKKRISEVNIEKGTQKVFSIQW